MDEQLTKEQKGHLLRMATYASTGTALVLITAKLVAWWMSDSISILATLIDSCLDALASLVNLFAVHHALQPADEEHRFGHGKAESLAGLGQAAFIAGSSMLLLLQALSRLFHPQNISSTEVGIAVMIFSIIATSFLLLFQQHVIRKTGSTAISADALHYRTDLLINFGVIIALLLAAWGMHGIDPIFGLFIAAYVLYSAWEIGYESVQVIMDRELPKEERQRIQKIVYDYEETRGMHDLRTRRSGTTVFIQLHLELEKTINLTAAHTHCDAVEELLEQAYPDSEIIIHADPEGLYEQRPDFA
ncbi:MAG: cation diffusion facilitator family transporter [Mariprofundales bacterium]